MKPWILCSFAVMVATSACSDDLPVDVREDGQEAEVRQGTSPFVSATDADIKAVLDKVDADIETAFTWGLPKTGLTKNPAQQAGEGGTLYQLVGIAVHHRQESRDGVSETSGAVGFPRSVDVRRFREVPVQFPLGIGAADLADGLIRFPIAYSYPVVSPQLRVGPDGIWEEEGQDHDNLIAYFSDSQGVLLLNRLTDLKNMPQADFSINNSGLDDPRIGPYQVGERGVTAYRVDESTGKVTVWYAMQYRPMTVSEEGTWDYVYEVPGLLMLTMDYERAEY